MEPDACNGRAHRLSMDFGALAMITTARIAPRTDRIRPMMPRMKPALATPRLVASPRSALFMPIFPKMTAKIDPIVPRQKNCRMPMTRAVVPIPF